MRAGDGAELEQCDQEGMAECVGAEARQSIMSGTCDPSVSGLGRPMSAHLADHAASPVAPFPP
jgi:hypothetical protein